MLEFVNVLVRVSTTKNNFQRRIIKLLDREVGLGGKARDKDVLFWGFFFTISFNFRSIYGTPIFLLLSQAVVDSKQCAAWSQSTIVREREDAQT